MDESLYQITAAHMCAGLVLLDDIVDRVPPIIKYMQGWPLGKVRRYCTKKGWELRRVNTDGAD